MALKRVTYCMPPLFCRMLECELEGLDAEAMCDVAFCMATQHAHIPPAAWVEVSVWGLDASVLGLILG